jgi:hypothetical protein
MSVPIKQRNASSGVQTIGSLLTLKSKQFLLEPQWQSHAERGKTARREGEIGLDQPFELRKRLLVERDIVKLVEG